MPPFRAASKKSIRSSAKSGHSSYARASSKKGAASKSGSTFYSSLLKKQPPKKKSFESPSKAPAKGATKNKKTGKKSNPDFVKGLVFIAMSFKGEGGEETFSAIKDSCKSLKLNARRVDENYTSGFVILEIVDLIEKAEFIIFDLTHERPNVYYELGYAHGVGNSPSNILLVAKENTELHFDISSLRVRFYKTTEDLRKIIKTDFSKMVKDSRL